MFIQISFAPSHGNWQQLGKSAPGPRIDNADRTEPTVPPIAFKDRVEIALIVLLLRHKFVWGRGWLDPVFLQKFCGFLVGLSERTLYRKIKQYDLNI